MASPYHFAASVPACGAFRRPLQDLVRHALKYGGEAPDQAEAGASAVVGLLGPADLGGTVTLTLEGHDGELTIRLRGAHLPATPAAAGARARWPSRATGTTRCTSSGGGCPHREDANERSADAPVTTR